MKRRSPGREMYDMFERGMTADQVAHVMQMTIEEMWNTYYTYMTARRSSLREAATSRGVHVLLFEGGEAMRFDDEESLQARHRKRDELDLERKQAEARIKELEDAVHGLLAELEVQGVNTTRHPARAALRASTTEED